MMMHTYTRDVTVCISVSKEEDDRKIMAMSTLRKVDSLMLVVVYYWIWHLLIVNLSCYSSIQS
jgi:hypothetical protein